MFIFYIQAQEAKKTKEPVGASLFYYRVVCIFVDCAHVSGVKSRLA